MDIQLLVRRDLTPELERLCSATVGIKRGDLVAYQLIEQATGIARRAKHWQSLIRKWRNWMLQRSGTNNGDGIWMVAIPNVGYRALLRDEQLKDQPRRIRKSIRRKIAQEMICLATIGDLLETDQRLRDAQLSQSYSLSGHLNQQATERRGWLAAPEQCPRVSLPKSTS